MKIREMMKWQADGYQTYHFSCINLWIHIIAVPFFITGTLSLLLSIITLNIILVITSLLLMATSIGVQGYGHGKEKVPAIPFSGFVNAVTRIFLEQLITFPLFVLTGQWYRALKNKT